MKSLDPTFINKQNITQNLLQTIRLIGEYKGKQDLYKKQSPQVLETLRTTAIIQSTESSNRIEGITVPQARIRKLVTENIKPKDRSEQEIAGYQNVLKTIHNSHPYINFTPNIVLQFHRDLYQFSTKPAGCWKNTENQITATAADGSQIVRFRPVPAYATPGAMEELHNQFNQLWHQGEIEPLLLIANYVLDFLCIHPFLDGNGRMARLITLLLLYKAGYQVGQFISLEKIIEQTKENYYDALYLSDQNWHEQQHSLLYWWEYFLGVMLLSAYRQFEERVGAISTAKGTKTTIVLEVIKSLPLEFSIRELQQHCPLVSIDLIRRILRQERDKGSIQCVGKGVDSRWRKLDY